MTAFPATERPRCVLLTTDFERGGAAVLITLLARHLGTLGWKVHAVSIAPPGAMTACAATAAAQVHTLDTTKKAQWPRALGRLNRLLGRLRPAVLQGVLVHANVLAAVAGRVADVPVVCTEICTAEHGERWHVSLEHLAGRLADRVICNSASVHAFHSEHGLPAEQAVVINHGVDLEQYRPGLCGADDLGPRPSKAGPCRVCFAGRLEAVKGVDVLAAAWRQVQRAVPGAELLVAGSGRCAGELAGLPGVRMLGWRTDLARVYASCTVGVFPSRWEGFGLAAAEAMACGLACVLTRVSGLADLAEHGQSGWYVDPEDAAGLAAALIGLLNDGKLRRWLGAAAAERVRHCFDARRMARQHDLLYRSLLAEKAYGRSAEAGGWQRPG